MAQIQKIWNSVSNSKNRSYHKVELLKIALLLAVLPLTAACRGMLSKATERILATVLSTCNIPLMLSFKQQQGKIKLLLKTESGFISL